MGRPPTGIVFESDFAQLYVQPEPTPHASLYFPRGWNPGTRNLLIIDLHGTVPEEGTDYHYGFHLKQMGPWPTAATIGDPGTYGAHGTGPDYALAANGTPVAVPAGLAPVGRSWPALAEAAGVAVCCPRMHAGATMTGAHHRRATRYIVKSIIDGLRARGWIGPATKIVIGGHSSGGSEAILTGWTFPAEFIAVVCRHSAIDTVVGAVNGDVSIRNNDWRWDFDPQTRKMVNPVNAGVIGTYNFILDDSAEAIAARALPIYVMSGDDPSDGPGDDKSWVEATREAKAGWMTTYSMAAQLMLREYASSGDAFTDYDDALHGPTVSGGAGGRYDWARGAHNMAREDQLQFALAVFNGEPLAARFDR